MQLITHINQFHSLGFFSHKCPKNGSRSLNRVIYKRFFKDICKEMNKHKTPTPDILLIGDFNFPKAQWNAGIGVVKPDSKCNRNSLQQLINIASDYSLLQYISEGTRETRKGGNNILELIFTNNHELI